MESSNRKKFTSPFSLSRPIAEKRKQCCIPSTPQQGQWSVCLFSTKPDSGVEVSKSKSAIVECRSSDRSREKALKTADSMAQSISESGSRQKVCRSLFNIKTGSLDQNPNLEQESHVRKQSLSEIEFRPGLSMRDEGFSIRNMPQSINWKTPLFVLELPSPEVLSDNLTTAAFDCIVQEELIGQLRKVEINCLFDFCDLLKPEAVEKFRSMITPTKAHETPPTTSPLNLSGVALIDSQETPASCIQKSSCSNTKEKLVQMPTSGRSVSSGASTFDEINTSNQKGVSNSKKHNLPAEYLFESLLSNLASGKRRTIRGFSIPRCGRMTNQSYQEQSKEFQEIFSSKVRQIAEVTDCLQHTELLYEILQI